MFYMRPDQDFLDALRYGLEYFEKRYNEKPMECIVHPDQELSDGLRLVIKAERYILRRNFWLIQRENENN